MIIAITGAKGSGKTTLGFYLEHSLGYEKIPMAAPLKGMLKSVGLTEEQLNGDEKETPSELLCGRTPRQAMQTLGTEWGRLLIGQEIWTNLWQRQVKQCPNSVVVDDIRYPNEMSVAQNLGAVTINVRRNGIDAGDAHTSELYAHVMKTDYVLTNDGTFEDLYQQFVDKVLPNLKEEAKKA